jgi:hypothetical protein
LRWIAPAISLRDLVGRRHGADRVIGIGWLREPSTALKIVNIGLIIAGVFGLDAGVGDG